MSCDSNLSDHNFLPQPFRYPWGTFPPVWIHAGETEVKQHPAYNAAKAGDPDASYRLVTETLTLDIVEQLAVAFATRSALEVLPV